MNLNWQIRPATEGDAAVLAALGMQVWLERYAQSGIRPVIAEYVLQTFTEAQLQHALRDPQQRFWLAEQQGHAAGFIQLGLGRPDPIRQLPQQVEVDRLYVQACQTRQGLGPALLGAAREVLQAEGWQGYWLTVWQGNPDAIRFYQREQFQAVGVTWFELEQERHENQVLAQEWSTPRQ